MSSPHCVSKSAKRQQAQNQTWVYYQLFITHTHYTHITHTLNLFRSVYDHVRALFVRVCVSKNTIGWILNLRGQGEILEQFFILLYEGMP